jgi:hypothetical protein
MGQLTVTVGTVTGTLTFDNTKGGQIINDYIAVYGGPTDGTNQEKMDWFILDLARHVRDAHHGKLRRDYEDARDANVESSSVNWN